ncbi:hypothetical protein RFI_03792 [Reticulomyxa filosa]|uniref:Uncharacterized protein n=1 Tax=Reticulomyxa filosa TaxID=46433 RepID=X6P552_RETFI|nr:hypothetical protein RFI_03792 [Reticulomyxa filosa]|eukprot:ETO33316.1 hypothetical protein RFI_03792 [Reticulomyxa filosa]
MIIYLQTVTLLRNLNGLHAYDLRNVFYASGDKLICEILYSYSINGTDLYDYVKVNSLLTNVNQMLAFENESNYLHYVHEIEKTFAKFPENKQKNLPPFFFPPLIAFPHSSKHGVIQSNNRTTTPTTVASKATDTGRVRRDETKSDEKIDDKMISSQVCAALQKYHPKLAQRLYSFSVDGATLFTLSYQAIARLTGVTPQELSEDAWHKIAHDLGLPKIVVELLFFSI